MIERRSTNKIIAEFIKTIGPLLKLGSVAIGAFTILGSVITASVLFGQHIRADTDQDTRLSALEERIHLLEVRHDENHPSDRPLSTNTKEK